MDERMDAAFYSPEVLQAIGLVSNEAGRETTTLGEIVDTTASAFYEAISERYVDDGVPFVRVGDVRNGALQGSDMVFLDEQTARNTPGLKYVSHPSLFLSKGGSVGRIAMSCRPGDYVVSRDVIGLVPKESEWLGGVLFFLASYLGRAQVLRGSSRQVQAHLTLERLKCEVVLPLFSPEEKKRLNDAAREVADTHVRFEEARAVLEAFMGNEDPFAGQTERRMSFVVGRDSSLRSRMDPRFFRPELDEARKEARTQGWKSIGETSWVKLSKATWERSETSKSQAIRYVPLSAVEPLTGRIHQTSGIPAWQVPARGKWRLHQHDVLVPYLLGSLDKIGVVTEQEEGGIGSSGFLPLQTQCEEEAVALAAYLSTSGAQHQITSSGSGTVMQSISENLLLEVLIPPKGPVLTRLAELMESVRDAASEAKQAWRAGIQLVQELSGWSGAVEDADWDPEDLSLDTTAMDA